MDRQFAAWPISLALPDLRDLPTNTGGQAFVKSRRSFAQLEFSSPFDSARLDAITTSTSRAILRRSVASLLKRSRFLTSVASLPRRAQSSASLSSFSSLACRFSTAASRSCGGHDAPTNKTLPTRKVHSD